jgi:hypothetical protein
MPRGVRAILAPSGGLATPMRGQTQALGNVIPKCQVALGSALRKGQAIQALGVFAWAAPSPGARSSWLAAAPKLVLNIFSSLIHSMSNAPQLKDNLTPPPLPLQLFVSRAELPLHRSNPQYFVSM